MKYHGSVGYAVTKTKDDDPDTWINSVEEHQYFGDVLQNSSRWQTAEKVNDNLTISNRISILADPFAFDNFQHIKYATWMNQKWKVTNIEVAYPRLILTIGGEWNGETEKATQPVTPWYNE
jgi:hypothetical protein